MGAVLIVSVPLLAAGETGAQITIPQRAAGSDGIVVASVRQVAATFERNTFGDNLIVSHVLLGIEETLKGDARQSLNLDVLGGTAGGWTLKVSSLPSLAVGERAVFFLERGKDGIYVPHLRGLGILKLDRSNHVRGSSLTLDDVRALAQGRR